MPSTFQVGTILTKDWPGMPELIGFETEPGLGEWSMVKLPDAFTFDRKLHAAGWSFFFMAAEVKAMFFGSLTAAKVRSALKRILHKVKSILATCNTAAIWTGLKYARMTRNGPKVELRFNESSDQQAGAWL